MDLHSSSTLSLYSQVSLSSVSRLRDLICKTSSSSHHCTDYSDLCLCSGSVSLCSKNSLSLTSLSMLSCQLTLMGLKQSSEPSTTALTTMDLPCVSPTQHLCSTSAFELFPSQQRVFHIFQVTCSADTRLKPPVCTLAFITMMSFLLWTDGQ